MPSAWHRSWPGDPGEFCGFSTGSCPSHPQSWPHLPESYLSPWFSSPIIFLKPTKVVVFCMCCPTKIVYEPTKIDDKYEKKREQKKPKLIRFGMFLSITLIQHPSAWHKFWTGDPVASALSASEFFQWVPLFRQLAPEWCRKQLYGHPLVYIIHYIS